MTLRISTVALLAVFGLSACNVDADGDGEFAQFDCDDTNAAINTEAPELCDGLDNDCDGIVDNDTTDAPTFYADFDRDGFGDPNPDTTTSDCRYDQETGQIDPTFQPAGYVSDDSDCDDQLTTVNPDADERCDGIDNDCDGETDEDDAIDQATWYEDADDDGYGDAASTTEACDAPTGYVGNDEDCNDTTDASNPGADEICDGDDNDCDGDTDEDDALDASAWYADADEDGFGDPDDSVFACAAPEGYIADNTDCDDEAETANPDGVEVCDGLDNDCDSTTSEDGTISLNATQDVYTTFGEVLDAAITGDTVYICAGTWNDQLAINAGVTVVGGGGSDNVIIDVEGADIGAPVSITSTDPVTLEGLTIRNGFTDGGEGPAAGGIDAYAAEADVTLRDIVVEDCESSGIGGVLGPEDADLIVEDSEFSSNEGDVGGGVLLYNGSVKNTRILDNEAGFAGGGLIIVTGDVTLEDTRIISNYARERGGGIAMIAGASVTGGTVLNNLSDGYGGGIWVDGTVDDIELKGNRASVLGGGFYVASNGSEITNSLVEANRAPDGAGGGSESQISWTVSSTDILDNEASKTGGGLYLEGSEVTMETCAVEGNTATAGGGIHLVNGTLSVTTSDFGTAADSNDNDPDDIFAGQSSTAYDAFGTGESFECDDEGNCI